MLVLQGFVRRGVRGEARIPRGVGEVVRRCEERCTVERKHGRVFGDGDRRQRGFRMSGRAGVHILHRWYPGRTVRVFIE